MSILLSFDHPGATRPASQAEATLLIQSRFSLESGLSASRSFKSDRASRYWPDFSAAASSVCARRSRCACEPPARAAIAAVTPDVVIGTFGKALGTFGAFAASSRAIADLLWNRARSFVFSTALPPSIPAATLASIEIVRGAEGHDRRRRLAANGRAFRELVPRAG